MKMQIKECALFTGVSVHTLHYYDEKSLFRTDEILFYREPDCSLKDIDGHGSGTAGFVSKAIEIFMFDTYPMGVYNACRKAHGLK